MSTIGAGSALPVCKRVNSSKHSSRVPKPPGRTAKAADSFINMSLRVKKYFISTTRPSAASWGCEIVSKGSRISTPSDMSGPAPSAPAAMMPGPAPVTTSQCSAAMRAGEVDRLGVERVGDRGPRRAEHRQLRYAAIVGEQVEGSAHLGQSRGGDLEIEAAGVDVAEGEAGHEDVTEKVAVRRGAG